MPEYDCRSCKMWKGCPGKAWFHYGEIRFCPLQVLWIIEYRGELASGHWPKDPDSSDDNSGQRRIKTEATFTKSILILAEVEQRLQKAGIQAELLVTQIEDGRDIDMLSEGAYEVLMYVKGNNRKRIGFKRWLREIYHRKKGGFLGVSGEDGESHQSVKLTPVRAE